MIRIVIAEDQEMLLGTIGALLDLEEDMEVVGKASNGEEAIALVHQLQPDVCIMDVEMPEMSGLEAAEVLKSDGCKIMILTTFARTGYFQRVLNADVRGYLLKDSPSDELAFSIRSIMDDTRIYSPELVEGNDEEGCSEPIQKSASIRNYFSTFIKKIKVSAG
nr:response regulator transcription factor [Neobacillus sp. Marseille-Q6967]